ncbi:MAG: DUF3872 domain-containing protein [Paludibacter sp.]|nr:DUF3872 domain-containing protein [Paludibacter sp.]
MRMIPIISVLIVLAVVFVGCTDKLDIQQVYEFSLSTMPVQKKIKKGETVEIRCQLNRVGRYEDSKYIIGYFQSEGKGILKDENGQVFMPNDFYELSKETFRLYYTSLSADQQVLDLTLKNNFNQEFKLSITFTNDSSE